MRGRRRTPALAFDRQGLRTCLTQGTAIAVRGFLCDSLLLLVAAGISSVSDVAKRMRRPKGGYLLCRGCCGSCQTSTASPRLIWLTFVWHHEKEDPQRGAEQCIYCSGRSSNLQFRESKKKCKEKGQCKSHQLEMNSRLCPGTSPGRYCHTVPSMR